MLKINNPFYMEYPVIDLHGLDKVSALISINEFINDNIKLKNYNILIIHRKGSGILKSATHEYLSKDKRVDSYKLDNFNDGMTIVKIKEEL